jgi:hypothetical protein
MSQMRIDVGLLVEDLLDLQPNIFPSSSLESIKSDPLFSVFIDDNGSWGGKGFFWYVEDSNDLEQVFLIQFLIELFLVIKPSSSRKKKITFKI